MQASECYKICYVREFAYSNCCKIYAEARIHVVNDDVRRAGQLRVGVGEGQQLGGVGLQVKREAEGVQLAESLKLKSEV